MKNRNQAIFTISLIIATLFFTVILKTLPQSAQKKTQDDDYSRFPVAHYDEAEPVNREEREKRKETNKRYDNMQLVSKNPNAEATGSIRFDETPSPPAIPAVESELVLIGEVLAAEGHMSNDRGGVYAEFTIKVEEVLKNTGNCKVAQGGSVTVDRAGGWVSYPNGQKLIYAIAEKMLPLVGKRYVLFLTNADKSPNHNILTAYELKDNKVYPLDISGPFQKFKGTGEADFITAIREGIEEAATATAKLAIKIPFFRI